MMSFLALYVSISIVLTAKNARRVLPIFQPHRESWLLCSTSSQCAVPIAAQVALASTYELDDSTGLFGSYGFQFLIKSVVLVAFPPSTRLSRHYVEVPIRAFHYPIEI